MDTQEDDLHFVRKLWSNPRTSVRRFKELKELEVKSEWQTLHYLGTLIDICQEIGDAAGLRHAIQLGEDYLEREALGIPERVVVYYDIGNAWAGLYSLELSNWEWTNTNLEEALLSYRIAASLAKSSNDSNLTPEFLCRLYTNLGNEFSHVGRFIEAHDYWDRALALDSSFAMALANKAYGLEGYLQSHFDGGQRCVMALAAVQLLERALQGELEARARLPFEELNTRLRIVLEDYCEISKDDNPLDRDFSLGTSKVEQQYRKWCLKHRFFLNPLNDVGPFSVAAHDYLGLPSIVTQIDKGPRLHGLFNQLKQEFVSARYVLYEGLHADSAHFSDRGVLLINTLDYPSYGLAIEKVKMAFRVAFSLLDKVAFFFNTYFDLGIPERQINFKSIWFTQAKDGRMQIRPEIASLRGNWPLRGLVWLSKDISDKSWADKHHTNPDAREMGEIRNHLEHKYLKVHDGIWVEPNVDAPLYTPGLIDDLPKHVYRWDLERFALQMIRTARDTLIYLCLAVAIEERHRSNARGNISVFPFPNDHYDDDWNL